MDIASGIKAILFDFDGTIINLGLDLTDLRQGLENATSKTGPLIDLINMLPAAEQEAMKDKLTHLEIEASKSAVSIDGAQEVLGALAHRYKLAVVSRNSSKAVRAALKNLNLDGEIVIVGREHVRHLKPNPESLLLAMNKMGVTKGQSILVGDTIHDVEAAHACDIPCIILRNPQLAYIPRGADHYIDSLSELMSNLDG